MGKVSSSKNTKTTLKTLKSSYRVLVPRRDLRPFRNNYYFVLMDSTAYELDIYRLKNCSLYLNNNVKIKDTSTLYVDTKVYFNQYVFTNILLFKRFKIH